MPIISMGNGEIRLSDPNSVCGVCVCVCLPVCLSACLPACLPPCHPTKPVRSLARSPTLPLPPYPILPYPALSYPTLPYPTLPYPTLPYHTSNPFPISHVRSGVLSGAFRPPVRGETKPFVAARALAPKSPAAFLLACLSCFHRQAIQIRLPGHGQNPIARPVSHARPSLLHIRAGRSTRRQIRDFSHPECAVACVSPPFPGTGSTLSFLPSTEISHRFVPLSPPSHCACTTTHPGSPQSIVVPSPDPASAETF
ncbi:uncharacterized protein K452DRAFT_165118 [Aplosporella prunicola CBS 121167]|uniref:Uncharacterized protein n=1 Tax=Aplosporella prunicola CBS 121167 TaxID=1176127 RepID=A0A6A6AUW3_9PEZI|nr:uncharacterized protein K452DRAFT_165118 [Aplosporella prunicola CBS 121167]KAF2135729.1 hypothetical protein K452DRAFT_165118 [Aplosporella prunicola CBS 121167]